MKLSYTADVFGTDIEIYPHHPAYFSYYVRVEKVKKHLQQKYGEYIEVVYGTLLGVKNSSKYFVGHLHNLPEFNVEEKRAMVVGGARVIKAAPFYLDERQKYKPIKT